MLEVSNCQLDSLDFLKILTPRVRANLRILRVGNNDIQSLPEFAFTDMLNLQLLDLSANKIKAVGAVDRVFDGLTDSLRELHMQDNRLTHFGFSPTVRTQGFFVYNTGPPGGGGGGGGSEPTATITDLTPGGTSTNGKTMPPGGYGLGIPASGIPATSGAGSGETKTAEQVLAQMARVLRQFWVYGNATSLQDCMLY